MGGAHAKSQNERPLRVLNRGTGAPDVREVSTPSNANRTRRRTQKEVGSAVGTRPTGESLSSEKTTSRTHSNPLMSPFKPLRRIRERQGQNLSVEDTQTCVCQTRACVRQVGPDGNDRMLSALWDNSNTWMQHTRSLQRGAIGGCSPLLCPPTCTRRSWLAHCE